ncbi:hypothetical protein HMPREF3088_04450 [Corynebacterium sp. HMSC22B11]|uniref:Bax inhibitor-1/YccA family protein n=1 Tax=Corynebacterium sp. HMSC22B11 TaxID=1581056 RepID=UPI0008A31A02|nr:Bax inhibitor-1/YccA family protein [Corynebacterium sp. HMSC22B11]OFO14819.1 hypothetical protein HMPREF3088_04450 [Corynebacterium sp. HMSC22B11]
MQKSNPFMAELTGQNRQGQQPQGYGQPGYGQQGDGYGQFATSARGAAATATYQDGLQDAANYGQAGPADRPITVDDVVAKTGITLGVIVVLAAVNYFIFGANPATGSILTVVGAIGGLITVLVSAFAKKYGSPVVTLLYAGFEGLFVGGFSYMLTGMAVGDTNAGAMISQAILGTIGVFAGMLFVYKTGAIRVTPKFTKFMVAALIGVLVLALGSLVIGLFTGGAGPLRDGSPLSWIFSLLCIGLAALSFLQDFDAADRLVRAGAPSKMAWGVALGLAVTLVWLYTEILRLLSYINRD